MLKSLLLSAALFVITLILVYFHAPLLIIFILIILTMIKTAHLLGNATEELANYYSPTIGGLLNATLGNTAELIIGFFALKEGLIDVVKASITGSMIGNILLVFGLAIVAGGLKKKEMKLKKHEAEVSSTMLLITVLLLLFPSLLILFHEESHTVSISIAVAISLMALYLLSLVFSLYTHKEYFLNVSHEKPTMKKSHAFFYLLSSIIILMILSEIFASKIEAIAHNLHFGELFVGAILVGIAGNAAEHLSAIRFARKDKMSLVLNTTIGSSLQVAMFVAPLLVFFSLVLGNFMSLTFLPLEIIAIIASVLLINEVARDGSVNWLEGIQLVVLYIVIAVLFFFHW